MTYSTFPFHTLDYNLLLRRSSMFAFVAYTDADWAGCLDTLVLSLAALSS
jgi:hypothetical protein